MKKAGLLILCLLLVICTVTSVQAIEPKAAVVTPTLNYNGTTAQCSVQITAAGKTIYATMQLWYGSTLVDSWTASGTTTVSMSHTCSVQSGLTYTLKVGGTIGGETFTSTPISKKCP